MLFLSVGALLLTFASCKQNKSENNPSNAHQNDSLEQILSQKDSEINDMMGLMNEVQEGFRQINEAENRVTIAKDGEGADKKQMLRDNVKFIAATMQKNRELIAKLRQQLSTSSLKGTQLKATIDNLVKQLDEKDQQLQQLRADLDAKDIHIGELDETISNLNTNVNHLTTESKQRPSMRKTNSSIRLGMCLEQRANSRSNASLLMEKCCKETSTKTISRRLISVSIKSSSSILSRLSCSPCTLQAATPWRVMPTSSLC